MHTTDPATRGLCLVLSAPSGAGKSTIARALLARDPGLALSVSATTRAPRPGERDGIDYHFLSPDRFEALSRQNGLLEQATVFGRRYGTPRAPVEAALTAGRDVLFDIDWQGHRSLRAALPGDVLGIFILPPSPAVLRARLAGRAADDAAEIERRLAEAQAEIAHAAEFDHVLVNDDLETCVRGVESILERARKNVLF